MHCVAQRWRRSSSPTHRISREDRGKAAATIEPVLLLLLPTQGMPEKREQPCGSFSKYTVFMLYTIVVKDPPKNVLMISVYP